MTYIKNTHAEDVPTPRLTCISHVSYLRGREPNHVNGVACTVLRVELVKIAPGGPDDEDTIALDIHPWFAQLANQVGFCGNKKFVAMYLVVKIIQNTRGNVISVVPVCFWGCGANNKC